MSILAALWGRFAGYAVSAVMAVAAIFGMIWNIKRGAKDEMRAEIQAKTVERIQRARDAVDAIPADGDVRERLRDKGYLRD